MRGLANRFALMSGGKHKTPFMRKTQQSYSQYKVLDPNQSYIDIEFMGRFQSVSSRQIYAGSGGNFPQYMEVTSSSTFRGSSIKAEAGKWYKFRYKYPNGTQTVDGVTIVSGTTYAQDAYFGVGACSYGGLASLLDIAWVKAYDADGNLIRDYIPTISGLKDKITGSVVTASYYVYDEE